MKAIASSLFYGAALALVLLAGCPPAPGPVTPQTDADAMPAPIFDASAPEIAPPPTSPDALAACKNLQVLGCADGEDDGGSSGCAAVLTHNLVRGVFPFNVPCMKNATTLAQLCATCPQSVSCCPTSGVVKKPPK